MTQKFECGDNATLVSYLYGEGEPGERSAIEAHLKRCPACAAEIEALGSTRTLLAAWTPPEADLGFRIVSESRSKVLRPPQWWRQPMPAWAQAAAAVLIFGTGLSLGVISRTAEEAQPVTVAQAPVPAPALAAVTPAAVSADDLAALEQRLRAEMSQLRTVSAPAAPASVSDSQLLAQVRTLIDESEQRQRRELALRTAEVVRDVDAQRQFDFARVQRALGQFEGQAGAEFQRQRRDLNNLIRVSQRPQ
jgi:anti-sigma factor RsiW